MANADFSQKQNSTPGGFDAGSYREKARPEGWRRRRLRLCRVIQQRFQRDIK